MNMLIPNIINLIGKRTLKNHILNHPFYLHESIKTHFSYLSYLFILVQGDSRMSLYSDLVFCLSLPFTCATQLKTLCNSICCCPFQCNLSFSFTCDRAWDGLLIFFFSLIFISWRLITLQYCSGFCHTLTWISHGFTCVPHPDAPSHLPPHPIPLDLPSAPAPSTCLMHPTWTGDLFTLDNIRVSITS